MSCGSGLSRLRSDAVLNAARDGERPYEREMILWKCLERTCSHDDSGIRTY